MKYLHYLVVILTIFLPINAYSEIVEVQKDEKHFGSWVVLCENDVMVDATYCKIASKFYENRAVISLEPSLKLSNQLILVIPNAKVGQSVKIKIDKNDIIFSDSVKTKDFGLIPLSSVQKSIMLNQMKKGDFLFLQFNISDIKKEVTVKINLKDFHKASSYYHSRITK
jgi:hypothetical protein